MKISNFIALLELIALMLVDTSLVLEALVVVKTSTLDEVSMLVEAVVLWKDSMLGKYLTLLVVALVIFDAFTLVAVPVLCDASVLLESFAPGKISVLNIWPSVVPLGSLSSLLDKDMLLRWIEAVKEVIGYVNNGEQLQHTRQLQTHFSNCYW